MVWVGGCRNFKKAHFNTIMDWCQYISSTSGTKLAWPLRKNGYDYVCFWPSPPLAWIKVLWKTGKATWKMEVQSLPLALPLGVVAVVSRKISTRSQESSQWNVFDWVLEYSRIEYMYILHRTQNFLRIQRCGNPKFDHFNHWFFGSTMRWNT